MLVSGVLAAGGGGALLNRVNREVFTEQLRLNQDPHNQILGSITGSLLADVPFLGLFPMSENTAPSKHQFLTASGPASFFYT